MNSILSSGTKVNVGPTTILRSSALKRTKRLAANSGVSDLETIAAICSFSRVPETQIIDNLLFMLILDW